MSRVTHQMMDMPAGIKPLLIALMLDAHKRGFRDELICDVFPCLDIADEMSGPRHRCQNERARLQQPPHSNGKIA